MKKLSNEQKSIIVAIVIVIIVLWYFLFFKKKGTKEESGYDSSWKDIGDGFFIPNNSNAELAKKYIDGTVSTGIKIDINGNCLCGAFYERPHGIPGSPHYFIEKGRESIPYPKEKGFTKSDGRGNYFYFEPLSDLQMREIDRLNELKRLADEADRIAAKAEADKIAADKEADRIAAEKATEANTQKAAAARAQAEAARAQAKLAQARADAQIAAAKQRTQELELEKSSKNKKIIAIIIVIVLFIITGFIWYKKRKNS